VVEGGEESICDQDRNVTSTQASRPWGGDVLPVLGVTIAIAHLPHLVALILAARVSHWFENHTVVQARRLPRAVFIPLSIS
jgi:hypothetical protein